MRPVNRSRFEQRYTLRIVKHSASVIVWGAFSEVCGRGGLYFQPKNLTMKCERYVYVLRNHMLNHCHVHGTRVFMHDGAPCHMSKKVAKFLSDNNINAMKWPGNTPDLNSIEIAWKIIE